ncbi:hypothetical protein RB595_004495 [Gaeumannomyces hyphopodioides]
MQEATDILIVGAGPTGLTLALELAKHGASFRIVEKEPERHSTSRAIVVQPRTQELLDRHTDFREEMLAKSSAIGGVRWHLSKTRRTYGDFTNTGLVGTDFPSIVNFSQVETEGFLETNLGKVTAPGGGRYVVERGLEVTAIAQDPDGVTVTLSKVPSAGEGGGASPAQQTIRCKYVVGCDGAHSAVRKTATSIRYEGGTYRHDFILCDATLTGGSLQRGDIEVGLGDRFVLVMPLAVGGAVRVACARDRGPGFERHVAPTLAEFQALLDETYGDPGTLADPTWLTAFRLHWRCASRYREGRLFVAGDAAHIHSPLGGQGMNTGIQDAINLAWKLAAATTSPRMDAAAADALLDTYDEERRPVGENLIRTTDRMFRLVTIRNPVVVWLRRLLVPWVRLVALCTRARRRRFFTFISQFGIHYRRSSIVGTARGFRGPVRGGDRLPDGPLVGAATAAAAVGPEGGGRRDSGVVLPREATLQRLLGGTAHHLLVFSAAGAAAASTRDLALAAAEVAAVRSDVVAVAILCGGGADADADADDVFKTEAPDRPTSSSTFRDVDGSLHARYGFSKKPGYVLCRPDGYAAHVGHLSDLGELVSFLKA